MSASLVGSEMCIRDSIYVALPPEVAQAGMCAKLNRSLCGARAAPARWAALYGATLEGFGFARGRAAAFCFCHSEQDIRCVVRGDDFTFAGYGEDLDWMQGQMEGHFVCKVAGKLGGGPQDLREIWLLSRIFGGPRRG
eukprot:10709012-Alexandrium_andersonii.AAC.1